MKSILMKSLLLFLVMPVLACAQDDCRDVPDIAREEIARRGDLVVHAGQSDTAESNESESITQEITSALAPPPDDSHKWFITVIGSAGCQPCERLKQDWASNEGLRAWARPDKPAEGWAFWNYYQASDQKQKWRWNKIRITGYPTILLQPPRNGEWGDPSTVVCQITGYSSPTEVTSQLSASIRAYVAKVKRRPKISDLEKVAIHGHGQAPPFDLDPAPAPNVGPPPSFPVQPTPTPSVPIPVQPGPAMPTGFDLVSLVITGILSLLAGQGANNVLVLALIAIQVWRTFRKATNQPQWLDDATFDRLVRFLQGMQPKKDDSKPQSP